MEKKSYRETVKENAVKDLIGMGVVFSPKSTAETVKDGKRNFLYIYDERFPERDNELFAILRDYNDDSYDLIYIYEVE